MIDINIDWAGSYPCLCLGEWILKIDGEDYSSLIPFRKNDANTYSLYEKWNFDKNWIEKWESYTDGLKEPEWIAVNLNWLKELPVDKSYYSEIYKGFNSHDFRCGSCGGCIF